MEYHEIQLAAFVPDPARREYVICPYGLSFPEPWRTPVLDLFRHGKPAKTKARSKEVPIRRLNAVLRTLAPDLIAVDTSASFDDTQPWIYADAPYPPEAMNRYVRAWLRDLNPDPSAYPLFQATARQVDASTLHWEPQRLDLLKRSLSLGMTAVPASPSFRLLPETIASRIAALPPYEYCGQQLSFRRVAVDARANGAELMSWPPLLHVTKKKGGTRLWHYSAVIRVTLRTVPFSPVPRLHIGFGIRRWVNGPVWMPPGNDVSVYLLADDALVHGGASPGRFAVARLTWDRRADRTLWANGGPEGMLVQLSALDSLPQAEVLAKEPETWITGRDGVTAAVAYHTRMGWHGVGAGLMPSERRRLTEWAVAALEPEFRLTPAMRRSDIQQRVPRRLLQRHRPIPKEPKPGQLEHVAALNEQIADSNAAVRRSYLAAAVGEQGLTVFAFYQSALMRDYLIKEAETSLGLSPYRAGTGPDTWAWEAPEFSLRIHARQLGAVGSPLGGDKAPIRGEQWEKAIAERRASTAAFLNSVAGQVGERPQLAFVELDGPDAFRRRTTDPKFAIRLGCANAGVVSQFLRPRDPEMDPEKDDSAFRAAKAWADGLRQIGVAIVPSHSLGDVIPADLNQVAFWMVKRRIDGPTGNAQFTPIAILIRPGQDTIMGKSADMDEWVPYPDLLKSITGQVRPTDLKTADAQAKLAAAFIQKVLFGLRGTPALAITHAQNTRSRWKWLQNSELAPDRVRFGGGPEQRLTLHGKQLRLARIAASDRDETPEWWAPKPDGSAGIAKGLWLPPGSEQENRVFYSTTGKSSTHHVSVDSTKLTPHLKTDRNPDIDPAANAWNPELLELSLIGMQPQDKPEEWAMYLHQQRFPDDYPDGLRLPLIVHLAKLTAEYALPHDDDDTDPTAANDADDTVEDEVSGEGNAA
jgi:hypothetical protein